MGVLAVVGAGRPGLRGGEEESGDGVGWRGGTMQGEIGTGRDAGPLLREGRNKVAT